jgi:hypothetical protein
MESYELSYGVHWSATGSEGVGLNPATTLHGNWRDEASVFANATSILV